ncbi:phosphoglucosamine mutase [Campylobacter corcagiensis]|uniref:Phosphoglucosamine mutase n=1 Tax=Campylobacter corcagiensis TaxID=1448857 RepID=A0A7M1LGY3_9BACT|nr:phosphoglucosamine mutase [Campylobacter corcagiensis]QKF63937.1 phosphoglucosamine mutase [Campylobacter corcagiensis]QOQ87859.1 phosphoglucosamine mutase [Campylobacter corcagiensis]
MKYFGTDGVRGLAGKELTAELAMKIAVAAGIYFRENGSTNMVLLGKDTRRSGYMIETAIVAGLTSIGYNVRQIGPMPTPAVAFLTEDMRCDAGIMISASHNPYYDNGIKFFDKFGFKLDESEEAKIEEILHDNNLMTRALKQAMDIGAAKRVDDVIGRYIVHIKNSFPRNKTLKNLRIVLDTANGASYKVAPTVFKELGAEVFVLSDKPNGQNINDSCGALHPENLSSEVRRLRADVGFAFDGDADRLTVVDENGSMVNGDALLGILAIYLKENNKLANNKVVATVMSNQGLDDMLKSHGIELLRSKVGDKYVLEMMREHELNFGGEQSGHIIFADYAKTGDGLTSALQFAACMLQEKKSASQLASKLKPYPQILKNLKISEKKDLANLDGLRELENELKKAKIRSLFRYSGTEKVIRLLLEGKDEILLADKMNEVENFFKKALNG